MDNLRVLLVGAGGYAAGYVRELYQNGKAGGLTLIGVADPYAKNSPEYEKLLEMDAKIYDSVEAFYAESSADLAIISTPIPLHAYQATYCMEQGSHVLLEKPIAATMEEAQRILDAQKRTKKHLAIGYQWCYDRAMRAFQQDVRSGLFGKVVSMKALVLWPRNQAYFSRGTGWAGKKYAKDGAPIFDCVASNATAHYLENMLWLSGCELTDIRAETFRANPIETFDTLILRGRLGEGRLTFVTSHAADYRRPEGPMFEYAFEKGRARFGGLGEKGGELTFEFADGTKKEYGVTRPDGGERLSKLWDLVDVIRGAGEIACPAEEAMRHTRVMKEIFEKWPDAQAFDRADIREDQGYMWVPGLYEKLVGAYQQG